MDTSAGFLESYYRRQNVLSEHLSVSESVVLRLNVIDAFLKQILKFLFSCQMNSPEPQGTMQFRSIQIRARLTCLAFNSM